MAYRHPSPAQHELRTSFNAIVETGVVYFWRPEHTSEAPPPWLDPQTPSEFYRAAFRAHEMQAASEALHWARAAKALARAYWHEAKIAYFKGRTQDLPSLGQALNDEYRLHERLETTRALIERNQKRITPLQPPATPPSSSASPSSAQSSPLPPERPEDHLEDWLQKTHACALRQLEILEKFAPEREHELLHAEHLKCATEYARCTDELIEVHLAKQSASRGQPSGETRGVGTTAA